MNNDKNHAEPFPFKSPWSWGSAFVLTIGISFLTAPLKGSPHFQYIHDLIHARGPTSFIMIFVAIAVSIPMMIVRIRRQHVSGEFLMACAFGSLFPTLFGMIGTVQGLAASIAGYAAVGSEPTIEKLVDVQLNVTLGQGIALDPLLLGTLISIFMLSASIGLVYRNKKYQPTAGEFQCPDSGNSLETHL